MISLLRKLRSASRLSARDWQLFWQAWLWLLFFDLSLRTRPFTSLQAFARQISLPAPPPEEMENLIRSVRSAVDQARSNHIYPMTCLRRALTLQKMLAGKGLATELKIGVRKEAGQLSAHAWLEYQGNPLGEPEKVTERYATLEKASANDTRP